MLRTSSVSDWILEVVNAQLSVDPWTLDARQDAQVGGEPRGAWGRVREEEEEKDLEQLYSGYQSRTSDILQKMKPPVLIPSFMISYADCWIYQLTHML